MKNERIRLVVADIDLTLQHYLEPLPKINLKAIEALHENGILFGLASGRSVIQLKDIAVNWKLTFRPELLIGVNGQALYDGIDDKEEKLLLFEKEWVEEILDFLDGNGYNYHAYIDDYSLFRNANSHYYELFKKVDRDVRLAEGREDFLKGDFYKFLLAEEEDRMDELKEKIHPLLERHKKDFKLLKTTPQSYEIVHAKTSKAYALERFCKSHAIPLENVAAFGDADNDNEMLQISGMGVCLKNGEESTKRIADYITDLNCEDGGFGDFVFKHIL